MSVLRVAVGGEFDREKIPDGLRTALLRATAESTFEHLEQRLKDCEAAVWAAFESIVGPLPGKADPADR